MRRATPRASFKWPHPVMVRTLHSASHTTSPYFRVVEHVARCQHIRDRPAGTELFKDNALRLSVKQYVPKDDAGSEANGVTLIGAHANGFPKEIYEPLWDDIYEGLQVKGRTIRSIWIADQYNQGQSGVMNEKILGPDPSWWDHGRDLMSVVNQFQDEIPHPIIGVGHSMGGLHLVHMALMHPRLFDALVLIDPVIQIPNPSRIYALASTYRRDLWPSRAEAKKSFGTSKFYQKWDPRVLESWIKYGLRELPTEQYPNAQKPDDPISETPVTLTTTKAQEVYNFLRPGYLEERLLSAPGQSDEMEPDDLDDFPMYRPEPPLVFRDLKRLRPDTLYIFGNTSELSSPTARQQKMDITGVGLGGSGGQKAGKVSETVLDCGHLVPMEQTKACADAITSFIVAQLENIEGMAAKRKMVWEHLTRQQRVQINDNWRSHIGEPPKRGTGAQRPR